MDNLYFYDTPYFRKLSQQILEKLTEDLNKSSKYINEIAKSSYRTGFIEGEKLGRDDETPNIRERIVRNIFINTDMSDEEIYEIVGFDEVKWIEHIKYLRKEYEEGVGISKSTRSYRTGDVAKMLGETPAMIGYYCRQFSEYLGLSHTTGQHRVYNDQHVKNLKYIIYLMKDKRMTAEQTKEFLAMPEGKALSLVVEDNLEQLLVGNLTIKDYIADTVRQEVHNWLKEKAKIIEESVEFNKYRKHDEVY